MVLFTFFLLLTCLKCAISQDEADVDIEEYEGESTWEIKRERRSKELIKDKFPEQNIVLCQTLHVTDAAPFTAIILYKGSGRLLCMGTIIDSGNILSAKRCYDRADVKDLLVLVGYYKAYWGNNAQVLYVRSILRHEYEVAILKLKSDIKFTDYVQSVRLPSSATRAADAFYYVFPPPYQVIGFEVDKYDMPGDYIEKDKTYQLKEDTAVHFRQCEENYSKLILDSPKLFCTIGNATFCWGGWGGPVLKWSSNYYLQIGIIIADNCTADTNGPLLAARTDVYADWIRGNSFQGRSPK